MLLMNAYVYIAIFISIFFVLPTYWKSKSTYVFLLLCAGNILSSSASGSVATVISNILPAQSFPIAQTVKIIFLLGPSLIGIVITKGSAKKKHIIFHLLSSIITSILGYLWFLRTLSYEQFSVLESSNVTVQLLTLRDALLGGGVILTLFFMLVDKKKKSKHEKSKKD